MSQPDRDSVDLVARVAHLERRQRRFQPLVGLTVVLTMAALVAFATNGPAVVQAQRVELVDLKGEVQAALAADTTGVTLTVFDKGGRVTASLRLNDDPRLTVRDAAGREVAALGAPREQYLLQ